MDKQKFDLAQEEVTANDFFTGWFSSGGAEPGERRSESVTAAVLGFREAYALSHLTNPQLRRIARSRMDVYVPKTRRFQGKGGQRGQR